MNNSVDSGEYLNHLRFIKNIDTVGNHVLTRRHFLFDMAAAITAN